MNLILCRSSKIDHDKFPLQPKWAKGACVGHRTLPTEQPLVDDDAAGLRRGRIYDGEAFGAGEYKFERCTFIRCMFIGNVHASFNSCRLIGCSFRPEIAKSLVQELAFQQCEIREGRASVTRGGFESITLYNTTFSKCELRNISFDWCTFQSVVFYETHGLPSCRGLEFVTVLPDNILTLNVDLLVRLSLDFIDRYASWEKLRSVGRLPLFGASLSALISIPVIFYVLAVYNRQVERLNAHIFADQLPPGIKHLIETLHPLPLPSLSLWLLISTLLLGVASTIFSLACPARVREFSLAQWMDDLGKPALHYLANSWSKRWARTIAAPCYLVGGTGTVIILLIKLWNAGEFIWKHSSFGWLS